MISSYVESHIHGLTDDELADYIATGTSVYEPAAVDFARQELSRRGLTATAATQVVDQAKRRLVAANVVDAKVADEKLKTSQLVLFFMAFLVDFIGLPLAVISWASYRQRGARTKASQIWFWYFIAKLTCLGLLLAAVAPVLIQMALRR